MIQFWARFLNERRLKREGGSEYGTKRKTQERRERTRWGQQIRKNDTGKEGRIWKEITVKEFWKTVTDEDALLLKNAHKLETSNKWKN